MGLSAVAYCAGDLMPRCSRQQRTDPWFSSTEISALGTQSRPETVLILPDFETVPKPPRNQRKSKKNQRKSKRIEENPRKSKKIKENQRKAKTIKEKEKKIKKN